MEREKYIQVGVTALRDPVTHEFLPSVPLYVRADEAAIESEKELIGDIAGLFAKKFKQYADGCRAAGLRL